MGKTSAALSGGAGCLFLNGRCFDGEATGGEEFEDEPAPDGPIGKRGAFSIETGNVEPERFPIGTIPGLLFPVVFHFCPGLAVVVEDGAFLLFL